MSESAAEYDPELLRRYLDSRAEDQQQLDKLEAATLRLSDEVNGLRTTLDAYATKEFVAETTVSPEFIATEREKALRDLVKLRLRIKRRTYILFGIAVALILLSVGVGAWAVHQQADQRHSTCMQRNNAARQAVPFYDKQIASIEAHNGDVDLLNLLKTARDATQKSIVKC